MTVSNKYQVQLKIRHTGKVGPGTHTWDLGPGTFHLDPFTWDPGPETHEWNSGPGTWDPPPGTLHLGPGTYDPIFGTLFNELIRGNKSKKTHFVYQSTVFCIVLILIYSLEFNSQFLIIAKWFQINTCWLFQFWITWCWKFN